MTIEKILSLTGLTDDEKLYLQVWAKTQERFNRPTTITAITSTATAKTWVSAAIERADKNKAAKERAKARKQQLKAYNKLSDAERDLIDTFIESALTDYKMTAQEIAISIENAGKEKYNKSIEEQIEALKKQLL